MKAIKTTYNRPTYIVVLLALLWTSPVRAQEADLPRDLDQYIAKVLDGFDVPGVGIAVVKDGKTILAKGYGVKRLGDPQPVDGNTLFSIASNSKAFTGTAIGMLVDEGKLDWEDRVVKYLPWFQLSEPYVTQHLTVRDLLVHHSGLPAYVNDMLLFPPANMTRKELLMKLKDAPLVYDFRSGYAYDNILYLAAAEVIEAVSGISWEDFIAERIFEPLEMDRSVSRFSSLKGKDNIAMSHTRRDGQLMVVDSFFVQNIGDPGNPAGGIVSTPVDMAKWMKLQLDSGKIDDHRRLFKPAVTQELWKYVVPIPISKSAKEFQPSQRTFSGYAAGFSTYDYRGHQIVGHGGSLTGFVSQLAMVPQLDLGIMVMTNQGVTGAYWSIIRHVLDYYMGAEPHDWYTAFKNELDNSLQRQDSIRASTKPVVPDARLVRTLPLEEYAGAYRDSFVGRIVIAALNDENLHLRFSKTPQFNGVLEHFHGDLFKINWDNPDRGDGPFLSFSFNADNTIREARFISKNTNAGSSIERIVLRPDRNAILTLDKLDTRIQTEIKKHPDSDFGITFIDLQNGDEYYYQGNKKFHAASTMKTPVMVEAFKQQAAGKFNLDDEIEIYNRFRSIADRSYYSLSVDDDAEKSLYRKVGDKISWRKLIHLMITESSNLATNILIEELDAKNIMRTLRDLGAADLEVLRGVEDIPAYEKGMNNQSTARDLAFLFAQMGRKELISKQASEEMLNILSDQKHRDIIPALLPRDVRVAHKTGWITGINHDSGLVELPDGRKYAVVLLSSGISEEKGKPFLARISKIFYDYVSQQ